MFTAKLKYFFKLVGWPIMAMSIFSVQAQVPGVEYSWEEKHNKQDIRIYTSKVAGSPYRAVRGEMQIKASVSALVALVDDLPNCPNWADLCRESIRLKPISTTEQYIYVYNNIPFPAKDRDVVAHMKWKKDVASGRVTMNSDALPIAQSEALRAVTKKAVRLSNATSQWHFTPLGEGMVLVESFAHIDPNGPTPAWITNMLLVDSPYKTMINMREIIRSGKYADATEKF